MSESRVKRSHRLQYVAPGPENIERHADHKFFEKTERDADATVNRIGSAIRSSHLYDIYNHQAWKSSGKGLETDITCIPSH